MIGLILAFTLALPPDGPLIEQEEVPSQPLRGLATVRNGEIVLQHDNTMLNGKSYVCQEIQILTNGGARTIRPYAISYKKDFANNTEAVRAKFTVDYVGPAQIVFKCHSDRGLAKTVKFDIIFEDRK